MPVLIINALNHSPHASNSGSASADISPFPSPCEGEGRVGFVSAQADTGRNACSDEIHFVDRELEILIGNPLGIR